jgi:hypothetical protein
MKICKTCCLEKDIINFSKNKNSKDNLQPSCRKCMTQNANLWKLNNSEKVKINKKKYYKKNSEKNKEEIKKYASEWRSKNKDKIAKYNNDWLLKNKNYKKEYMNKNQGYMSKYFIKRFLNDDSFKLQHNIRNLIKGSFKRACNGTYKKGLKTEFILGCTIQEFIKFISNKFTDGMTIKNHGDWHFDHIIPISSAKTEEEIIKLNHYTNFQPLWAIDNLKKGKK